MPIRKGRTRRARLFAQVRLGNYIRARRKELKLDQSEVAREARVSQTFYSELEGGTRSSDDAAMWLRLGNALQLRPESFLERVWEARGALPLRLCPKGDGRRATLLELAVEQFGNRESVVL
jgi:transcriptional regulator with XRE-family HTH domain